MKGFKHFFPAPALNTRELTVRGIGVQESMPPCIIDRPKGTGDWLLMLFYDPVWIGANPAPAECTGATLMIWSPGTRQYYGHREHRFRHTWLHGDGTWLKDQLTASGLPINTPLPGVDPARMEWYLLAIHDELTLQPAPDAAIVRNLLDCWMRETVRAQRKDQSRTTPPPALMAVRHFLESDYDQPATLKDLATMAGLSTPHFCAEFKRYFGTPAMEYRIRQRLQRAAYLLQDQNLRVQEVARQVGYEDLFHFSRLFKSCFGASPRAFRNRLMQKNVETQREPTPNPSKEGN